ncbi:type VII secretion protein EccB [Nocardioides mangrovi]|uniref:Type VII secretion protein EccB n=1 Tax=Nocardioides mangrovi TaxID=2874580 RepID=A0ABS7UDU4_9ACTN|nr:type VII secretion protein EccB [Nocardioides mangrovi]MBZ5739035.1 type VII secretion protein EccB [Nocardioides mangrovi]
MATKKDLVEAYSFSRRRLVTAFVSGAPGGREVEPARPGRTIVGGLALAVLLAAGAAIAGVFSPTAPEDWTQRGLIISKETGAAYVITEDSDDPELHPVLNSTSAALILGADTEPTLIEQDTIDGQRIGSDIGILGAPASVPSPSRLINTGWSACTADGRGVRMTVSSDPDVTPATDNGVTVMVGGTRYAVISGPDGAVAYRVPDQDATTGPQTDNLLSSLGLPTQAQAIKVSREWLDLFPVGADLDYSSFGLTGVGSPPTGAADLEDYRVGQLLNASDGNHYLITNDGVHQLTDFEAAVYAGVVDDKNRLAVPRDVDGPPTANRDEKTLADSAWPASVLPQGQAAPSQPCATLATDPDAAPVVQLADAGTATSGSGVRHDEKDQVVDPGRGAYVLSGSFTVAGQGSPYVIDSKGRANPLVGSTAAAQLGYADVPTVVVPDSWIKLFGCGVNLSQAAALSPPQPEDRSGCAD